MAEESFLLVSLKENKAKKLAQVINNNTSRLILDFLSKKKEATESEVAKDLNLPISTVHYNLKHLRENSLVEAKEYHYSEKGKEVLHYKLANKLIIIAPQGDTEGFREKLKGIWPFAIIGVMASAGIYLWERLTYSASFASSLAGPMQMSAPEMARTASDEAVMAAPKALAASVSEPATHIPIAFWFLLGTVFVLILQVAISWIKSSKSGKNSP